MSLVSVPLPGPTNTPASLSLWGTPLTQDVNEMVTLWANLTSARTAYTPTWASSGTAVSLGNGTISGRFMSVGKLGYVDAVLNMGSTTTFGTGTYTLSLPAGWTAAAATNTIVGGVECFDASATTTFEGVCRVAAGGTTLAFNTHAATAGVGQTVPMTWANTDTLRFYAYGIELA